MNPIGKIGFVLYDGFSLLDFATLYEALTRQGCGWETCATSTDVYDAHGLHFYPTRLCSSLPEYDLLFVPGGPGAMERLEQPGWLAWLATAAPAHCLVGSGEGVLLLAAAGLARGKRVAALAEWSEKLSADGAVPDTAALVFADNLVTAAGPSAALELARRLGEWQPQDATVRSMQIPVTGQAGGPQGRRAVLTRQTGETQVEVRVDIDGAGSHQIETGLPFLDHMLAQVAVHGLFDLYIQAKGDLQIDPHHTLEDAALTLGSAFQQALGDRAGIVRMASADCPMDESLAWVAVDFSGRPYSVIQVDWHGPEVGRLPASLFAHFFESFALNARCNLHAAVRYGRDDHHQAEALFKAFGRALCAATRIDPRRAGRVPSSKGVLF